MQAEVYPADLAENIRWSLEKGGEEVLRIDAQGNVTTLGVGTAYVVASVTDGDIQIVSKYRSRQKISIGSHLQRDFTA